MEDQKPKICQRTRKARKAAGLDQKDMPEKFRRHNFEVTLDAYNKYETRTPIRQHLIPIFCKIVNISQEWLLTGQGQMEEDELSDLISKVKLPESREKIAAYLRGIIDAEK